MSTWAQKVDVRRVVPYLRTAGFPTRSAIESRCARSDSWHLTGIYDTEKSARREKLRREKADLARIGGDV